VPKVSEIIKKHQPPPITLNLLAEVIDECYCPVLKKWGATVRHEKGDDGSLVWVATINLPPHGAASSQRRHTRHVFRIVPLQGEGKFVFDAPLPKTISAACSDLSEFAVELCMLLADCVDNFISDLLCRYLSCGGWKVYKDRNLSIVSVRLSDRYDSAAEIFCGCNPISPMWRFLIIPPLPYDELYEIRGEHTHSPLTAFPKIEKVLGLLAL
jgi:hypothetical protein